MHIEIPPGLGIRGRFTTPMVALPLATTDLQGTTLSKSSRVLVADLVWVHDMEDIEPATIKVPLGSVSDGYSLPPRNLSIILATAVGTILALLFALFVLGATGPEAGATSIIGGLLLGLFAAWALGDPWGQGAPAAVLHDHLYRGSGVRWLRIKRERLEAGSNGTTIITKTALTPRQAAKLNDKVFMSEMRLHGVGFVRRRVYFWAVRVFSPVYKWLVRRGWWS